MMEKAQNLQQTVKFFEKLLRASADGIVITDSAKNIIFVNEKFCKFFASKIHDVIETNLFIWLEKLDPDARDIWKGLESQTNKNGLANNVEFAMKTTEGMRYFSVNSSLLDKIDIEEEGLIISIWRDDTEHKVAQEALLKAHDDLEMRVIERTEELQESERKYRRLFEYSNDIILQVDSFGKVVAINNKIKETLGFTPEEVIGKYFFKLGILEIKELPGVVKQFKNAVLEGRINPNAGGLLNKLELSLRSKSRELILVETSTTILKKDEKIEGFLTNIRDITHRKHAEEEARLNSEIFKNVSEGIFLLGLEDGLIKHTNSKFEQMFGYGPGEMIGKDVSILNALTDKTPQETKEDILGLLRKTGEWHGEVNNSKKDGTLFWSYANVSLFDHPQYGRVIISVHTDTTEQKKAKETLKESEERFRGIFEQSPVAIEIYDQTGHLIDANRKCLDIFGIDDIGEVKNFNLFDDPNLPADVKNRFSNREAIEFESTFNFDLIKKLNLYNTTRSGQCYLDIRILPIWKENKSMSGYLVHVLDITERKKAELEREQFFKFFQISPDMMVIADPDGTFKKVNPATSDLLGYSETELLSKPFVDFVHPDDKQSTLDEIARQIKTGSSLKFENRYVCKVGTLRWLSWRANYNKYEGITYATARDITQSRQADEALHASQEHLHSIIEAEPECVKVVAMDGTLVSMNRAGLDIIESETSEMVVGKSVYDLIAPEYRDTWRAFHEGICRGNKGELQFVIISLKGKRHWMETHAVPIRDPVDGTMMQLAITRDITDRKLAEEFASRRNNQLRILSRATQTINTVLELPVILQNLVVSAMEITDSTAGTAGLIVNEKMVFSQYHDHGKLFPIDYVFKMGYGVPGHVMETKSPYISNNAQNDPYVIQDIRKTLGFSNLANVPILDRKGEMLGSFQIHNTKEHRPFDELDIEMLHGLASSAAIALENARLVEDIRKGEEEKKSLSSILEKSLNEIYMFDPETLRFTYANSGACKNLGFTPEELRSMTPPDIKPEYDEESFLKLIKPLIRHDKKKLLFYTDHRRANGSLYPIEVHLQLIEQVQRRLFLSIIIDITERKRTEKALSLSEEKFRTLYETMAQGVIYHDESGKIISANSAAQKILGLSPSHLIGRTSIDPLWKAIHEDGSDFPAQKHPAMVTLATRKEVRDIVMGIFNPELKEYRWIQINAIPQTRYAEIKPYQVYTTFNDITELKIAKDEMQLANEELRIINKIISTATELLDIKQILETVLDECIKILGLEGGTICLVKPDDYLQLAAHRGTSEEKIVELTTNKVRIGECLCGTAARNLRPLILPDREAVIKFATREATRKEDIRYHAAFPLITGGKSLGVLCIFTRTDKKPDVKKLKIIELISSQVALSIQNAALYEETKEYAKTLETKVEERTIALKESQSGLLNIMEDMNNTADELEKANKRLIELDRMKSMFIASTSHELRTPLNSIIGFTSILLEGWSGKLTDEQREHIQIVNTSGKHLLSLINDVIDISKIEAGKLEVNVSRFNLKEVIDDVVSTLKQEFNGKGLSVNIDMIDVELNTDRRRLLQCLINLFSNAVKFTEKGEIKIIAKPVNKEIEISIKDTGIGIKKEDIPKLFTAFTRLESSLTAKTSGTGLGLYLTMKLTREVLGGTLSVESEYHKGSIFSLRIPREVRV